MVRQDRPVCAGQRAIASDHEAPAPELSPQALGRDKEPQEIGRAELGDDCQPVLAGGHWRSVQHVGNRLCVSGASGILAPAPGEQADRAHDQLLSVIVSPESCTLAMCER